MLGVVLLSSLRSLREVEGFGASGAVVTAPRDDLAVIGKSHRAAAEEIPSVSFFEVIARLSLVYSCGVYLSTVFPFSMPSTHHP